MEEDVSSMMTEKKDLFYRIDNIGLSRNSP